MCAELEGATGSPDPASHVQAVVARCAPSDLTRFHPGDEDEPGSLFRQLFGGPASEHEDLKRLASPTTHVGRTTLPPFLVVHGSEDETVPYEQAQFLVAKLHAHRADVTLLQTVLGGHHNMLPDPDMPWSDTPWTDLGYRALAFFTNHLAHG